MNPRKTYTSLLVLLVTLFAGCSGGRTTAVVTQRPDQNDLPEAPPAEATPVAIMSDAAARPGRFDTGKMWTFENPPIDYFEETYGFRPDSQWFARARMGSLRLPNCSASFVSRSGLILTNHHCARESVSDVTREGENLLEEGFFARTLGDERKAEEMYAEQLIDFTDVTAEVYAVPEGIEDVAEGRRLRAEQIEQRLDREAKARDSTLSVQVVQLYHGGRYSAYTFRKYDDVRLVFAPHLEVGAFGGDPDNFTYPRYSLDFSFFRAYDKEGNPLAPAHYFPWSRTGTKEGDAVFVVGNPGSTSRLITVSQLEFERDYSLPQGIDVLRSRLKIMEDYIAANPDSARAYDLKNVQHQISNQLKKNEGELAGLRDPVIIARRQAAESELQRRIAAVDTLEEKYGDAIMRISEVQRSKEASASQAGAFAYFASPITDSHVLVRAIYGYFLAIISQRGAPADRIKEIRDEATGLDDWPRAVEREMLAARLREMRTYLGPNDPTVSRILGGRSPEEAAESIISSTALIDSASYAAVLDKGYLSSGDPTVALAEAITPLYLQIQQQVSGLQDLEKDLNAQLALARFALFGSEIPPDATFSLRLADGVVSGYEYNGTRAAPYTTFFGMYDHYYSYGGEDTDWDLPDEWLSPPATFERSTPVSLVSTNDITGGNSGSPLLNRDLQVVGVVFDSNIDALVNTYIYLDERGRAIAVDARGILEVLDEMYDADRIVEELLNGRAVATEDEADEGIH